MKYNLISLCSGYDSQAMAMDIVTREHGDTYELLAWSEIDKYAIQMHNLVFPEYADRNVGDMTKVDWGKWRADNGYPEIDLLTYSTPCQDISQAGKQAGLKEGDDTRSAILWSTENAIRELRPKFLLQENVKALVSQKFMPDFQAWMERVAGYGYVNTYAVLNAKDIGGQIPQNRERVFMLSMREDVAFRYKWPKAQPLEKKLEDILENEVEEKFFLNDNAVGKFMEANNKDKAVFVQVDLPPTHKDAMFVKTFFAHVMRSIGLWDKPADEIQSTLESMKCKVDGWQDFYHKLSQRFKDEYMYNLNRKTDDPEWDEKWEGWPFGD